RADLTSGRGNLRAAGWGWRCRLRAGRRGATRETEAGERILAGAAVAASVEQAQPAVGTEVGLAVFQVHRPLATRAHILGQACLRQIVVQLLAAMPIGRRLGL